MDDIGVIHMNGRIYDPKLGRMLSPDPVTQAPQNGQNYNRYTYAYNSPLKYTDPSGFKNFVLWDANNGFWGAGWSTVQSQPGQPANQQNYNTPGGVGVIGKGTVPPPLPAEFFSKSPHSASNESTVGDRISTSGDLVLEDNIVGEGEVRELTLGPSSASGEAELPSSWPPVDSLFWKNIADGAGVASLSFSGLTVICTACAPVTVPVAFGLTGVSIISDVVSGGGVESLEGGLAPFIEQMLRVTMSKHPVIKNVPKEIRDKISRHTHNRTGTLRGAINEPV